MSYQNDDELNREAVAKTTLREVALSGVEYDPDTETFYRQTDEGVEEVEESKIRGLMPGDQEEHTGEFGIDQIK